MLSMNNPNQTITLHTETVGTGSDLVLLHGWGMNGGVWKMLAEELSNHYRVTTIELPGHGHSPFTDDLYSLQDWADACLAAAPEQAAWIGWSLGGLISIQAAISSPHRISKLALVTSTPCFIQTDDWPHAVVRGTLSTFADTLRSDPQKTLERFLALQVKGSVEAKPTLRRLRQDLHQHPAPNPTALDRGLHLLRESDLRSSLAQLQCPTLWLLGGRDTLTPASVAGDITQLLPSAEIKLLPNAGHAPFLSHRVESITALRTFLEATDE